MWLINLFKGLIAPKHCLICNKFIEDEVSLRFEYICNECFDKLPLAPSPDLIFNQLLININPLYLSKITCLIALQENKEYIELIHYVKYQSFKRLGFSFGVMLGKLLQNSNMTDYDFIVPVPIHSAKERERGFNQSDIISNGISSVLSIPVNKKLIKRKSYTQTQTLLSKEERKTNVADVFVPFNENIELINKKCLLIDDVLTTGSTINFAAKELLKCGAERVDGATVARA